MRVKPQCVPERNPAAKPFLRSKNTDQLWFGGEKTGFFRQKNARFLPSENCVLTDDIDHLSMTAGRKSLAVFLYVDKSIQICEDISKPKLYV